MMNCSQAAETNTNVCVCAFSHAHIHIRQEGRRQKQPERFEENCAVGKKECEKGETKRWKSFDPAIEEQNWKMDEEKEEGDEEQNETPLISQNELMVTNKKDK